MNTESPLSEDCREKSRRIILIFVGHLSFGGAGKYQGHLCLIFFSGNTLSQYFLENAKSIEMIRFERS